MANIPMQLAEALTDRYTLERELGRGGMATVYLARDLRHDRQVALKVLRPELTSPMSRDRFLREIRLTARLQHPHILPVLDSGEANGLCWYTMPYVEGESLRARLRHEAQLPVDEAVRLAREVAEALDYAHRHQVIHRDIKPENVLLSEGHALVGDFGIAKAIRDIGSDQLTEMGLRLGTPAYMSPEQAAGDSNIDGRSDIYSLGCLLYELLAGRPPFAGDNALVTLARQVSDRPVSLRYVRPDVPAAVDRVIIRALAKAPQDRFATAGDLAVALTADRLAESRDIGVPQLSLPSFSMPLVGRERELAELRGLLEQRRLVTVVGPGGMGKSRLAVELASQEGHNYRDGAYFVPLSAVTAPDLIAPSIAEALGLTFATGQAVRIQLQGYLRTKQLLLVLDNFEQLLAGASLLTDLLQVAPRVRLVITSRERLNIADEAVIQLRGLPVPADVRADTAEEREFHAGAIELFTECARRVEPAFELSAEVQPDVIQVCRAVGGMPLALELAASMLRVLTPRELLEELERSMDALATPFRDVPLRHRSLGAVFESSWALLSEAERAVLKRLAVFVDGFRGEAAERVTGALLQALVSLCDKSLLHRTPSGRYEMHEVIRQYAAEKLREDPDERNRAETALSQYYADFVHAREERLRGRDQQLAMEEIAAEIGNVRAGWNWAVEHDNDEVIDRYLWGLRRLHAIRGWYQEGAELFRFAEASNRQTVVIGKVLSGRAWFCYQLGWLDKSRALHRRSLALLRSLGAEHEMIQSLRNLAVIARSLGKGGAAQRLLRTAIRICRGAGDRFELAGCLNAWGLTMQCEGLLEEAESAASESCAIRREIGDYAGLGTSLGNLAVSLTNRGRFEDARCVYQESLELGARLANPIVEANALINLGDLGLRTGRLEQARAFVERSLVLFRHMGVQEGIAGALCNLGEIAAADSDDVKAAQYFREALANAADISAIWRVMIILVHYAAVHARSGDSTRARELLTLALRHPATRATDRAMAMELLRQLGPSGQPEAVLEPKQRLDEQLERTIQVLLGRQLVQ